MKLLERTSIGSIQLKNRVIMAPMGTKPAPDGGFDERSIEYYVERAKGGFGMIITGASICTTKFEARPCTELSSFAHVDRLGLLCDNVHQYGAKICVQITPGLGRVTFTDPYTPPHAPSAQPSFYFNDLICIPFTVEEIHQLVKSMGYSALLAKRAGADAVEVHAYGGYLLDQFQTPLWNTRTDEYGGSLQNRMRFTLEVIQEIRDVCGKAYPVFVKFTPYHGIPGGRTLENEGLEIAKILAETGITALHVDMGCYENWYNAISTVYRPHCYQLHLAEAVKKVVDIPVIAQGKLFVPQDAEKAVDEKRTDFVALGHESICDPYWVKKIMDGREEDIRPCIGCNECLHTARKGKYRTCALNPNAYHEKDYPLIPLLPDQEKKRLLVVGAGPGGIAAALAANERGIAVDLVEASERIGGNLNVAGAPYMKEDVLNLVKYYETQLSKSNVKLHLGKTLSADEIIAKNYDAVILATGAHPAIPPIKGVKGKNVITADQALCRNITGTVVVIGGGLVGCETALHIARMAEHVEIVEVMDSILATADHCLNNDQDIRQLLADEKKLHVTCGAKVVEIRPGAVVVMRNDQSMEIPCTTVVLAAGYRLNDQLYKELYGKVKVLAEVAPAAAPGKIIDAVHQGYHAARILFE